MDNAEMRADAAAPGFEPVPDWGKALPELTTQDVADVSIGPDGKVYLLYRDLAAVVVSTPDGEPVRTIGTGILSVRASNRGGPHGVTVAGDGTCYVVDDGGHCVQVFSAEGDDLGSFGAGPSNPEFPDVLRGYPPFCRPTRLALAPWGEIYVSDGYGNARIHHYSTARRLIRSWGEPGYGAGEFNVPHSVYVDSEGRILVCDRENDRIQLFTADGKFTGFWADIRRPQAVVEDTEGFYFVAESSWHEGDTSPRYGMVQPEPSRLSVLRRDGSVVRRIGATVPGEPGSFVAAHGIAVDASGNLYVAEVSATSLRNHPRPGLRSWPALQKLRRVA